MVAELGKRINTSWINNITGRTFSGSGYGYPSNSGTSINNALEGYAVQAGSTLTLYKTDYTSKIVKYWSFPTTGSIVNFSQNIVTQNNNNNNIIISYSVASTENGIIKFDTNAATVTWRKTLNTIYADYPTILSSAQDSSGNVYITGYMNTGGGISSIGAQNPFLSKLDSSGNILWTTWYSSSLSGATSISYNAMSLKIGLDGYIYIYFTWADSGSGRAPTITKFNSSGTLQWSKYASITSANPLSYASIVIDSSGNVYLATGSADTGTSCRIVITKLNSSGTFVSAQTWTFPASSYFGHNMASDIDANGNLYFAWETDTPDVLFIAKFNSSFSLVYTNSLSCTALSSSVPTRSNYLTVNNYSNTFALNCYIAPSAGNYQATQIRLPLDGTKTGTYVNGSYSWVYATNTIWSTATNPTITVYTLASSSTNVTLSATAGSSTVTTNTVPTQVITSIP